MTAKRSAAGAAVAALIAACASPLAGADVDPALNGEFIATSDGRWAKKNEIFYDNEATVVSTWTITSSCTHAYDCHGTVTSDQGWISDITYVSNMWIVVRTLEDWEPCPDGTAAPGKQVIKFYESEYEPEKYEGWDTATGPSGACGINKALFIEMPFTLVPK